MKMDIVIYFLNNNSLTVNGGKTEILEMRVSQKRRWLRGAPPQPAIMKPDGSLKVISASNSIRLLGANFDKNWSWKHHLSLGEKALAHISGKHPHEEQAPPGKHPDHVEDYLPDTDVGGGLDLGGSKSIQTLINKCSQIVTGRPKRTRTCQLMVECNWLYFSEMVVYHSLLMLWKLVRWNSPYHLMREFMLTDENFVTTPGCILLTRRSFRCHSVSEWNSLSVELRAMDSFPQFKRSLRRELIENGPPPTLQEQQILWD